MSNQSDCMLYALSAWKEMSWSKFRQIFGQLFVQYLSDSEIGDGGEHVLIARRHTVRMLEWLGHCDFDFNQVSNRVTIGPSILALIPMRGLPKAILCGARGPDTLTNLKNVCSTLPASVSVSEAKQDDALSFVPKRVEVEADSLKVLKEVADSLGVNFSPTPPAWSILEYSASLQINLCKYEWVCADEINWPRRDFCLDSLRFVRPYQHNASLRLSCYNDPIRSTRKYYLWRDNERVSVDPNWARYAVLQSVHKSILLYDEHKFCLAIPCTVPPPRLIARGLSLLSGRVPERQYITVKQNNSNLDKLEHYCFTNVPHDIAELVCTKLSQELIYQSLPT